MWADHNRRVIANRDPNPPDDEAPDDAELRAREEEDARIAAEEGRARALQEEEDRAHDQEERDRARAEEADHARDGPEGEPDEDPGQDPTTPPKVHVPFPPLPDVLDPRY